MFGLGKPRSRLGKFIDKHGITQMDLSQESGVSRPIINRLCAGDAFQCTTKTAGKILKAIKKLTGKDAKFEDFWSM